MPSLKHVAIIVAGGSGSRMQSDIPKQFMLLNGRPVLMHTIEAFHASVMKPEIILVLNVDYLTYWEKLCRDYNFTLPHQLISGGEQRFHSVKKGLKLVKGQAIVAIHDAVRPLVSSHLIDSAYRQAEKEGSAVAAIKSRDSIRHQTPAGSVNINRELISLIQTPQVFRNEILQRAYRQDYRNEFTDDASVVERSGTPIRLIEGEHSNIKITFPEDIQLAEYYQQNKI